MAEEAHPRRRPRQRDARHYDRPDEREHHHEGRDDHDHGQAHDHHEPNQFVIFMLLNAFMCLFFGLCYLAYYLYSTGDR